jgi:putative peptidoglycan lipid II flippase
MIKKFTNNFTKGEKISESITRSAMLIATMGIASRFLGLLRDRILASHFGAGDILDAYYTAFKVPDLIYNLLILGALSAAFIPVFAALVAKNNKSKEAWKLVNTLLSVGVVVVAIVSVVLLIFSRGIINLIAFGYSDEKKELVVQMTRIMLLSPILLGISGVLGGILNSFKKFFFYSLSPIFYNLGIIIGAVFFTNFFGPLGLSLGVVLGALMHLLIQLPEAYRCGFKFNFSFDWHSKYFQKVIKLMIPRAMGIATAQVNLLIVIVLASTLKSGSLAIFNLANNLQSVPLGLFGISFAIASFPVLSRLWSKGETEEFISKLTDTLRKVIFLIIPFSALIYILRAQIVRVVLGTGKFNWEDTTLTFTALGIFTFSLWAQSLIPLLARAFYAIHDTKTPFLIGIFSEGINIILAIILIKQFDVLGLVSAFAIATSLNALALYFWLRKKVGGIKNRGVIKTFGKVTLATIILIIVVQFLKNIIGTELFGAEKTFLGIFVQLSFALAGGIGAFILMGKFLQIRELTHFIKILHKKIIIKKVVPGARDEVGK